jgi:hypothetical protein
VRVVLSETYCSCSICVATQPKKIQCRSRSPELAVASGAAKLTITLHFASILSSAGSPPHAVCTHMHVPPDLRSLNCPQINLTRRPNFAKSGMHKCPSWGSLKKGVDGITVRSRDRTILAGVGKLKGDAPVMRLTLEVSH